MWEATHKMFQFRVRKKKKKKNSECIFENDLYNFTLLIQLEDSNDCDCAIHVPVSSPVAPSTGP